MKNPRASHEVIGELVKFAYGVEENSPETDDELATPIEDVDEQLKSEGIDPQRVVAKLRHRLDQVKNRQNVAKLRALLDEPWIEDEPDVATMRLQLLGILNNGAFAARNFDQMTDADVIELWRITQRSNRVGDQP